MIETTDRSLRESWREWRRTRPLWAGLLFVAAGIVIGYGPAHVAVQFALLPGNVAVLGLAFGVFVALCGVFAITTPEQARIFGTVGIVLSILSLFGGALGGYLIGTLLGVLAGSLSVAWEPPEESARPSSSRALDTPDRAPATANRLHSATRSARDAIDSVLTGIGPSTGTAELSPQRTPVQENRTQREESEQENRTERGHHGRRTHPKPERPMTGPGTTNGSDGVGESNE
jgi:hypothetical protein